MNKLVAENTIQAGWKNLVNDAARNCNQHLDEEIEQ